MTCLKLPTVEWKIIEKGLILMADYIRKRGVAKFNRHIPIEIISELTPKTWITNRMNSA